MLCERYVERLDDPIPERHCCDIRNAKCNTLDIEKLMHVTLRVYQHPTEARTFYAPDAEPSLEVEVPVLAVTGLDNYKLLHPNLRWKKKGAGSLYLVDTWDSGAEKLPA